ncbi:MAG: GGDEF domain-containing protein, partial [Marinobacter sp.]
ISLLIYSVVTLARGTLGYINWWQGQPYEMPYDSFSYLLPYNFAIPALVMGFVGVALMTMQRILARSEYHAAQARSSAQRFERLMRASASGVAIVRDRLIVDTNPGMERLTGLSRDQLLRQPVTVLLAADSHDALCRYLDQGDVHEQEVLARHHENGDFAAEVSLSLLEPQSSDRILELRDISRHKALERQLNRLATRDPLTDALNRRAFDQAARSELERARRYGHGFCMALLDLDHFKRINDQYGHDAGDQVLVAFADCCRQQLRTTDRLARFGGEEFVILLVDTELDAAGQLLERIRKAIHGLILKELPAGQGIRFSAGLTQWQPGDTLESMVHRADQALYQAKRSGRDRIATSALATETSPSPERTSSRRLPTSGQ